MALASCPSAAAAVLVQGWPQGALQPRSLKWRTSSRPLLDRSVRGLLQHHCLIIGACCPWADAGQIAERNHGQHGKCSQPAGAQIQVIAPVLRYSENVCKAAAQAVEDYLKPYSCAPRQAHQLPCSIGDAARQSLTLLLQAKSRHEAGSSSGRVCVAASQAINDNPVAQRP